MLNTLKVSPMFLLCIAVSCSEGEAPKPESSTSSSSLTKTSQNSGDGSLGGGQDSGVEGLNSDPELINENISFGGSTKQQIIKYRELIGRRDAELSFLRNSEDKLAKLMLLNSARGCMLSQNIDQLEIRIGGGIAPDRNIGRKSDKRKNSGNPDDIEVRFGNDISLSINGNGLFKDNKYVTGDLSNYKIADLAKVEFRKDGTKYLNERVCKKKSGFLGIGSSESCKYEIDETNRWKLNEVKLIVNGVTIYETGGLDILFGSDGEDSWEEKSFKENRAYIEMLKKIDCE